MTLPVDQQNCGNCFFARTMPRVRSKSGPSGQSDASATALSAAITIPTPNDATLYDIVIVEDQVQFFVDDTLVATVEVPTGLSYPTNAGRLPLFFRVYNGSSSPAQPPALSLGQAIVVQEGCVTGKSWGEVLVSQGQGGYQSPVTPFAQNANHANSTSPVSATLSNTAAGYTTLGGRYQFAAVGGAVVDFALFAYQVPAGYQFYCTGVSISCAVSGVAVVTPTLLDWALGLNASAVSLATADTPPTSWAPRRIPVGLQSFAALAPVAAVAPDIVRVFTPPLVVDGGRFLHVILQVPNGAATASLIFRGDVMLQGYFE